MRSIKGWMEGFAEKPYAMTALFVLAFMESSFFPIPPDVLLIAIAVSAPAKSLKAALWCSLGSVFGGIFGYYIGYGLMETLGNTIVELYNGQEAWTLFLAKYEEWGAWFLAAAAFSPIPYKISTIASGAAHMDLTVFIIVSSLGRAGRFFLVGGLLYFIGPKVKVYIDKYFEKLSLAFVVLLVGGFVLIKYLF
jgi:membrane protein YqaA with SNARE-associated domain